MKALKNFIWEMLSESGKISSIRVGLLSMIFMAAYLVGCAGFYMIKRTLQIDGSIDWNGIGVLLAAIALFLSPIVAGKVIQKKSEQ